MTEMTPLLDKLTNLTIVLAILSAALVSLAIVDCVLIYRRIVSLNKRMQQQVRRRGVADGGTH